MPFPYKVIDLTHSISSDVPTWDATCTFEHVVKSNYDQESPFKFKAQSLVMAESIGTHIDSPAHYIPGGATVEELTLDNLVAPCVVVDVVDRAYERYTTTVDDLKEFESRHGLIPEGSLVIVRTGWDVHWEQPLRYRNNHIFPSVSVEAANYLLDRNIAGLGVDTLSPDRPDDGYHVHVAMLGAGKYIVENIANADQLPPTGSYSLALPIKTVNGTEAPMRLVALVNKDS